MLAVENLSCGYGGKFIVRNLSFEIERGSVLVLLGPNGIGKTTLFKTVLGLLPRLGGNILLEGVPLDMRPGGADLKRIAYVPQAHVPAFAFSVLDVVLMGRTPRMKAFSAPTERDRSASAAVLEELGLTALAQRPYTEISGGERQMALIARALVQQPDVLVMDEPTASLDLGNQAKLLRMVRSLSQERNLTVIMTSHNPDHALLVADDVLLMTAEGHMHGAAREVLTQENLSVAYGTPIEVIEAHLEEADCSALRSCALRL